MVIFCWKLLLTDLQRRSHLAVMPCRAIILNNLGSRVYETQIHSTGASVIPSTLQSEGTDSSASKSPAVPLADATSGGADRWQDEASQQRPAAEHRHDEVERAAQGLAQENQRLQRALEEQQRWQESAEESRQQSAEEALVRDNSGCPSHASKLLFDVHRSPCTTAPLP